MSDVFWGTSWVLDVIFFHFLFGLVCSNKSLGSEAEKGVSWRSAPQKQEQLHLFSNTWAEWRLLGNPGLFFTLADCFALLPVVCLSVCRHLFVLCGVYLLGLVFSQWHLRVSLLPFSVMGLKSLRWYFGPGPVLADVFFSICHLVRVITQTSIAPPQIDVVYLSVESPHCSSCVTVICSTTPVNITRLPWM